MQKLSFIILTFLLFAFSCNTNHEKKYIIGFSQCIMDDVWRQAMIVEMNIESLNYDNIDIILMDAEGNNQKQIDQIRELINMKVDVLIISPNEADYITPIAVEAYRSGIPTIITDRKINSNNYTVYVAGDSYQIGKMAGAHASSILPNEATILEVWGTKTTSPAIERHQGFIDGLDKSKTFNFLSVEGKWRREISKKETEKLSNHNSIDLVYAHNDVMAIGAREAIASRDSTLLSNITIMGVDGAFGKDAGLEAVSDGRLDASFLYPTGGDEVIKIAMKILSNEPVKREYILKSTRIIDKNTAQTLLLQSDQLMNYQSKIEQQKNNLDTIKNNFSVLRHSLLLILLLTALLLIFSIYIYIINGKIHRRNNHLRLKNEEINNQKKQLIILNEKIKEVNDQKIQFFMNVSHEIRTPLTLILNPLDKLIKKSNDPALSTDLMRMRKSTNKLAGIIDQLLDFQRIENDKMLLDCSEIDIVQFTLNIKTFFDELAESRNINYSFKADRSSVLLYFDADKMEKALMNLLSNAFKFTRDNGTIALSIHSYEETICIFLMDDGIGIEKEKLPYIFDRFYTDTKNNKTGTGIGLHLTQKFVKMHGGKVIVESDPNHKTVFTIELPISKDPIHEFTKSDVQLKLPETISSLVEESKKAKEILQAKYNFNILIVEDDPEIRSYLSEELSENLHVQVAENGVEALQLLEGENNISLVLSDVLMPKMNGYELCRIIKTTPEMSHISVILLTALDNVDQRLYGITEGADDYIAKPFHIDYIKIKIILLLKERQRLQKKFMQTMHTGGILSIEDDGVMDESDKIFMSNFISLLETSYVNSDLSIEKLSKELNISRVHLYRKIKDISGLTPVDILRNFRMSKAVELLNKRLYSVSEIAYQTGFSSPAYFSKCFKDLYSMTPSEYIVKEKN